MPNGPLDLTTKDVGQVSYQDQSAPVKARDKLRHDVRQVRRKYGRRSRPIHASPNEIVVMTSLIKYSATLPIFEIEEEG